MSMQTVRRGVEAGIVAGLVSGLPSTVLVREPLRTTRAAGRLLGRPTLSRGLAAHTVVSLGWGIALSALLPRQPSRLAGAAAGLAIAGLDLGLIGRRFPTIRALRTVPQVADHVAYGITVAWWLRRSPR